MTSLARYQPFREFFAFGYDADYRFDFEADHWGKQAMTKTRPDPGDETRRFLHWRCSDCGDLWVFELLPGCREEDVKANCRKAPACRGRYRPDAR